jgi:hypothetical protein
MKHIKLYEDYTDDEIRDLVGDLQNVGLSRVPLDIDYGPYRGMGEEEKEEERNIVDNWSFEIPGGKDVRVKSGSIKVSPGKITRVVLNTTNGDVLKLKTDNKISGTESFSINGEFPDPLQKSSWVAGDPTYTLDALTRYEHYLINKYKIGQKPPTFFQRLKKKLGLDESYSDDEIRDLMGDLRGVGHHKVDFDVEFKDYPETEEDEKGMAESWTSTVDPRVFLVSVEGEIREETVNLDLVFSNGDKANLDVYYMTGPHNYGYSKDHSILTLNGREHIIPIEKYMDYLEYGSVVRSALEIYDEIKKGTIK